MLSSMRTTVTLDSDAERLLRRNIRQRGVSFKVALNDAIRAALGDDDGADTAAAYTVPTRSLGVPSVNLDRALALAGDLEDEELLRKQRANK